MKKLTMLRNCLAYSALWVLFVGVKSQTAPYKSERKYHTSTLINNKLYILGGYPVDTVGKDFFYLDVSVSFNTQNLLWQDLSSMNIVPSHSDATSVIGGTNNNTLFLYEGDDQTTNLIYTFDPQNNSWSIPKITGGFGTKKIILTGIVNDNGKMYLWAGTNHNLQDQNDMLILDTINLSFGRGSLVGAPTPTNGYGATLLPNQQIIYIGE